MTKNARTRCINFNDADLITCFSNDFGYENWVKKFLEPVICNVITRVKYSCWSIKNFKTDQEYNLLDDVIQIHKKHGWEKLDIYFSMTNSKRPGNNNDSTTMKLAEETTYTFVESSPVNTEILSLNNSS